MSNKIDVQLNGVDLVEGVDYAWLPGKLVLKTSKPQPPRLGFWQKLRHIFRFEWAELTRIRYPYPDMVVVENWEMHSRDVYLFGTPEFHNHVVYEEDLDENPKAFDEGSVS